MTQTTRKQNITLWALDRFESVVQALPTRESQLLVKLPQWLVFNRSVRVLFWAAVVGCLIRRKAGSTEND